MARALVVGDPLLGLLGLARRGGKLLLGLEHLQLGMRRCHVARIFADPGLAERTRRELERMEQTHRGCRLFWIENFDRIADLLRKPGVRMVSVTDPGFLKGIDGCLDRESKD